LTTDTRPQAVQSGPVWPPRTYLPTRRHPVRLDR
jgi:hypothetical protein